MLLNKEKVGELFFKSATTVNSRFYNHQGVLEWIEEQNRSVNVQVNQTELTNLKDWKSTDYKIVHTSGRFFSIEGIDVRTNWGEINQWKQPIINQPEIGYLGFITKEFDGVLHFLMQAKIEPGNVNKVQISPTLQATKSNYSQIHKGRKPKYLEYFQNVKRDKILLDQLQSEQGGRFLKKRNRNIIIYVEGEIKLEDNFIWLTLGQVKELLKVDNVVNMDTRTVISGIQFSNIMSSPVEERVLDLRTGKSKMFVSSYFDQHKALFSLSEILSFITDLKCRYELDILPISLKNMPEWIYDKDSIYNIDNKYFSVVGADILIEGREVSQWSQPLIKPAQIGLCAFVVKEINGILHFIVQAKLECGNFDIIELAPTVQCLTGNYNNEQSREHLPYLDYVMEIDKSQILYNVMQSEEGGRFFEEQNRNIIILAGDEIDDNLPDKYIWMTLGQLQQFNQYNNYINIQARSLIAAIPFI